MYLLLFCFVAKNEYLVPYREGVCVSQPPYHAASPLQDVCWAMQVSSAPEAVGAALDAGKQLSGVVKYISVLQGPVCHAGTAAAEAGDGI